LKRKGHGGNLRVKSRGGNGKKKEKRGSFGTEDPAVVRPIEEGKEGDKKLVLKESL